MYKQPSFSKLSSRSLSKLKSKIEVAFSKQVSNENQAKNMQHVVPVRSSSTKSLAKSKYESGERNLPFSTAIKNGLMQTDRRSSAHQTPSHGSRVRQVSSSKLEKRAMNELQCKHLISGEKILGYSWFHYKGKQLISVSKKSKSQNLRYFAIKEHSQGKEHKKIIAAIQGKASHNKDGTLYVGSKQFILIGPNMNGLINKEERQSIKLEGCPFVLIVDESIASFTNLHKLATSIYELLADGVRDIDAVINILGRRLAQSMLRSKNEVGEQLFILMIVLQRDLNELLKASKR